MLFVIFYVFFDSVGHKSSTLPTFLMIGVGCSTSGFIDIGNVILIFTNPSMSKTSGDVQNYQACYVFTRTFTNQRK